MSRLLKKADYTPRRNLRLPSGEELGTDREFGSKTFSVLYIRVPKLPWETSIDDPLCSMLEEGRFETDPDRAKLGGCACPLRIGCEVKQKQANPVEANPVEANPGVAAFFQPIFNTGSRPVLTQLAFDRPLSDVPNRCKVFPILLCRQ